MNRGRHLIGQRAEREKVLRPVGVAFGMVHLQRPQQLLTESDRMDHHASDSRIRSGDPCVTLYILDDQCLSAGQRLASERRDTLSRALGREGRQCAVVDQRRAGGGDAVDPEVSPIHQPVGEPLDLPERPLKRCIARDGSLHQMHLVQIFGADRFFQDPSREHAKQAKCQADCNPADRRQGPYRCHDDDRAPGRSGDTR